MKKYLLPFLALYLYSGADAIAQDIHFSQFYENAILRNPALTGIFSGDYKAGVNYRTQWSNISVPFQTAVASAESRVVINKEVNDYLSFGITATYDKAGSINFNSYQVYAAVNYNKSLEDEHHSYLSLGFAGGYMERSVDVTKMTFSSQYINGGFSSYNPTSENLNFKSVKNYDLAAGISLNSSLGEFNHVNYYIGAAAYHILEPIQTFNNQYDFIRLAIKWSGNLGLKVNINPQYAVTLHLNYSNEQPYQEWIWGGFLSWRNIAVASSNNFAISAGLFYRLDDAIIPTFKIDYRNYAVTFSYDVNNSSLKPATNGTGGFEVSLYCRGNFKKDRKPMECPRFEDINGTFQPE